MSNGYIISCYIVNSLYLLQYYTSYYWSLIYSKEFKYSIWYAGIYHRILNQRTKGNEEFLVFQQNETNGSLRVIKLTTELKKSATRRIKQNIYGISYS